MVSVLRYLPVRHELRRLSAILIWRLESPLKCASGKPHTSHQPSPELLEALLVVFAREIKKTRNKKYIYYC